MLIDVNLVYITEVNFSGAEISDSAKNILDPSNHADI